MYILYPLIVQWDSSILVDGVARNSLHAATNCVTKPAVEEACSQVFVKTIPLNHILLLSYVSEVLPPATVAVTILCVLANNTKTPLPAKMTKNPLLSLTAMFGPSQLTCHER